VYGDDTERATAGQRTALNLAGVEPSDLARGMMLADPGVFHATSAFDCSLELLPSATHLKQGAPVHFHAGSAEIEAQVRLFDRAVLQPGDSALARIVLREPALLLPGDRFIIRRFSPVTTIGGGVVLDNTGLGYRNRAAGAARLTAVTEASPADFMAMLVRESGFGIGLASLIARTGLLAAEIESIARESHFVTLRQPEFWVMDASWFRSMVEHLTEELRRFHRENPLAPGIAKQDLRGRLLRDAPPFVLDALLAAGKEIVVEGDVVHMAAHKVVLREEEARARAAIERAFEQAGLTVPPVAEALLQSQIELKRARSILQILIQGKKLVRVSEELVFHHSAIQRLKELLANHRAERLSVPTFKDWTGVSRKYAIPLLEYLDRERMTRRDGGERIVL
jgi:selenocysteine-specific elongation factor